VGFERILNRGVEAQIAVLEEIAAAEGVFHGEDAGICKRSIVAADVNGVMRQRLQVAHNLIDRKG
jgi:hypothetical protein